MTAQEPSPTRDDEDSGPVGPGPGVRWSGDGSLAPRRAPRWGSGDLPAADPLEVGRPVEPPPARRSRRESTVDGRVLASPSRRVAAFFVDLGVKIVLFVLVVATSGADLTDPQQLPIELLLGAAVLNVGYAFIFGVSGLSPGGRLLRTRVVALDGSAPGVRRSLLRSVFSLNETVLYVSATWIMFDRRRQALYDKFAGTVVVMQPVEDEPPA